MKTFLALASITVALMILVSLQAAAPSPEEAKLQQELHKRFQDSHDAVVKGDLTNFERNWAEEYTSIDSFGVFRDKKAALENLKSASIESWKLDDLKLRVYGNTVVATSRSTAKGSIGGTDVSGQYLSTVVLVNRDGKWLTVSNQFTRIAKPQ